MAEVFYSVSPQFHRVARLEAGEVVELDFEIPTKSPSLLEGIFLGRVIEIQKPLHVAFVDVGREKPGMLALREGSLPPLKQGDHVLVQVSRDENPLENKGVRLTRLITLSLGPLLYTPFKSGLSLSKRIKERAVFKDLFPLESTEGLIVRHWASSAHPLVNMFLQLRQEWQDIQQKLPAKPPVRLKPSSGLLERVLRALNPGDTFTLDDRLLASQTHERGVYAREKAFDERCEEAWESLHSLEIPLPGGGNLYIEETHGLVVVDVNSQGALHHSLSFNKKAVRETFRQIRLRELAGKIVVDLISPPRDVKPLLQGLEVPRDLEIWGLSSLGLLEMTRRRKRLSLPQRLRFDLN